MTLPRSATLPHLSCHRAHCPILLCPGPPSACQPYSLALPACPGLLHPTRGCRAGDPCQLPSGRAVAIASGSFASQTEKHIMGAGRLKTGNEHSLSASASTEHQGVSFRGIKSISKAKIFDGLANSFRGRKISFNILQFPSRLFLKWSRNVMSHTSCNKLVSTCQFPGLKCQQCGAE